MKPKKTKTSRHQVHGKQLRGSDLREQAIMSEESGQDFREANNDADAQMIPIKGRAEKRS